MKYRFELGDEVVVDFSYNQPCIYGRIIRVPNQVEDRWIIWGKQYAHDSDSLFYVKTFQSIKLVQKGEGKVVLENVKRS